MFRNEFGFSLQQCQTEALTSSVTSWVGYNDGKMSTSSFVTSPHPNSKQHSLWLESEVASIAQDVTIFDWSVKSLGWIQTWQSALYSHTSVTVLTVTIRGRLKHQVWFLSCGWHNVHPLSECHRSSSAHEYTKQLVSILIGIFISLTLSYWSALAN